VSDETQACDAQCNVPYRPSLWRRFRWWLWVRVMSFWRRRLYRHVMRFAHRYNWHYAPSHPMPEDKPWEKHHWCQWCGLRGTTLDTAKAPTPGQFLERAGRKRGTP